MMPYGPMGGGVYAAVGLVFTVLFLAILIFGILALASWLTKQSRGETPGKADTALETLRQRYAKGEISKEEYEAIKSDLTA